MSAHSNVGPSGAHRWMICSGSVNAEKGLPDSSSEYAEEGTRAHALAHYLLDPDRAPLVEADDDDMTRYVFSYVEYVKDLGGNQHYEVKCDYSHWVPEGWGTADAVVLDDLGTLHVIDLKYGKGLEVSPIENEQAMLYALGAWNAYSLIYDIDNIVLHIVQPRLNNFKSWELNREALLKFAEYARDRYEATLPDDAPLVPDAKACQWCKAKATCRALATVNMEIAQLEFGPYTSEVQEMPDIDRLTTDEQSYIYKHKGMIASMMTAIEQNLTRELQHGRGVRDFKLVIGRSTRKWLNTDDAEKALRKVNKLKVKDIFKTSLISPTQAEKLLGKGHALLAAHVTKPDGKPTIVLASDKREAVTPLLVEFGEYNEHDN